MYLLLLLFKIDSIILHIGHILYPMSINLRLCIYPHIIILIFILLYYYLILFWCYLVTFINFRIIFILFNLLLLLYISTINYI